MSRFNRQTEYSLNWTYDQILNWQSPEPYDIMYRGKLFELPTPHNETLLLVIFSKFDELNQYLTFYGIEAPRECPMRSAFEWGELTWDEYWSHKDAICHLEVPFSPAPIRSQIIRPNQINHRTKNLFSRLNHQSPFDLKRRSLEHLYDTAKITGKNLIKAEQDYLEFMARHGDMLKKSAA